MAKIRNDLPLPRPEIVREEMTEMRVMRWGRKLNLADERDKVALSDMNLVLEREKHDQAIELVRLRRELAGARLVLSIRRVLGDPHNMVWPKKRAALIKEMTEIFKDGGLMVPQLPEAREDWENKK